jgi:hypothetical protein
MFFDGRRRHSVEPGCFLFVAAGQPHWFEDFTGADPTKLDIAPLWS